MDFPEVADGLKICALATVIAAKSVTLNTMRYVIVHPAIRASVLSKSGILRIERERSSKELEGNMSGRVARVSQGLATFLYETDDSPLAVEELRHTLSSSPPVRETAAPWSFVLGPPSRF